MERMRFSIKALLSFVLVCALGMAALRNASEFVAASTLSLVLLLLGVGILGAVVQRGHRRAYWIGFASFGLAYIILVFGSWDSCDKFLVSLPVLERLNLVMNSPVIKYRLVTGTKEAPNENDPIFEDPSSVRVDQELAAIQRRWEVSKKWFLTDSDDKVVKSGFETHDEALKFYNVAYRDLQVRSIASDGHDPKKIVKIVHADNSKSSEVSVSFNRIGHGIFALLLALLGGSASRLLYLHRDDPIRAGPRGPGVARDGHDVLSVR